MGNAPFKEFEDQKINSIAEMATNDDFSSLSRKWFDTSCQHNYSYNFTWMGRPIIQYPQDIIAMQEIIWESRPEAIIETGIAHGGSLVLYASLLQLLGGDRKIMGIDIDIREHNHEAIVQHPMFDRITLVEGSSIDETIAAQAADFVRGKQSVMVILDSNHTHKHVLKELELYSPLVTQGNYLVVFDTVIEDMPENSFPDRPWGRGNNPKTAVQQFLTTTDRFESDKQIEDKLLITVAPGGYLKCVKSPA